MYRKSLKFSNKNKLFLMKSMILGCKCQFKLDLNCIPLLRESEQYMPMKREANPNMDLCDQNRWLLPFLLSKGTIQDLLQTLHALERPFPVLVSNGNSRCYYMCCHHTKVPCNCTNCLPSWELSRTRT